MTSETGLVLQEAGNKTFVNLHTDERTHFDSNLELLVCFVVGGDELLEKKADVISTSGYEPLTSAVKPCPAPEHRCDPITRDATTQWG